MKPLLDKIFNFLDKYNRPISFGWLLFCTVLLLLPGNEFPSLGLFQKIYLDKWIHIGIFSSLVFIFCFRYKKTVAWYWLVLLFSAFGYIIEWIQKLYIPFRSFDVGDIYADIVGCILGFVAYKLYLKSKPL